MADVADTVAIRELLGRLTPRQREVCLLLADGRRQVEAARMMGITPQSVNYHVKCIRKLLRDKGFDVEALRRRQSKSSRRRRRKVQLT
ncbi:MAG TPA: sigma factor-like helix-turn-helix DNA-binding protein [Planctomycetota bacterium]|nr:sigma factor-like helix-turn-helix DNA-binding protein [Planctomycetota bacterium]